MTASRTFVPILSCLSGALLLGACASDGGGYPSLARRPAERVAGAPLPPCADPAAADSPGRVTGSAEPVAAAEPPPPPPAMSDPGLPARLAALVGQARTAHERFRGRQPATERAIGAAAGGGIASDAWSNAQIALAELESARNDASAALSQLDSLHAEDSLAHTDGPGPDSEAIAAARGVAAGLVAEEEAVLARLRGRLPG